MSTHLIIYQESDNRDKYRVPPPMSPFLVCD